MKSGQARASFRRISTGKTYTALSEGENMRLPKNTKRKDEMKKTLLSIALAVAAPFAWAQASSTTTTTTTTESDGTITEYTPGSMITLRESSGPRHYRSGKTVTYVTQSGKTLDAAPVKTRVRVGVAGHSQY